MSLKPEQTIGHDAGESRVWFTSMGLATAILMIAGLIGLIVVQGLDVLWPKNVVRVQLVTSLEGLEGSGTGGEGGEILLGEVVKKGKKATPLGTAVSPDQFVLRAEEEWQLFIGNKDVTGMAFRYVDFVAIRAVDYPSNVMVIERTEYGDAIGFPVKLVWTKGREVSAADPAFSYRFSAAIANTKTPAVLHYKLGDGSVRAIGTEKILRFYYPNRLGLFKKTGHFFANLWHFLWDDPREANTEGGIFPAIFGTLVMTMLMSLAVTPFGVLAAIYLTEYAKQGPFVRLVRISVNNLAGVPSIVFGVFGLGFFVYLVGGGIDRIFFANTLPTPTFGTGGILWASLTLALMTVPVVIVATEEALSAVPRGVREGSLACGASKWQTIQRIILPASAPGILTGLILAMARGASEVAPLMLVGVVKLAPSLPVDGTFPFVHLDQKFMHLAFYVYDLGFQSPDSDAAKPMVFMTTLVLIALVLVLNVGANAIRERLRRKYETKAF